jgi:hypothetical protein
MPPLLQKKAKNAIADNTVTAQATIDLSLVVSSDSEDSSTSTGSDTEEDLDDNTGNAESDVDINKPEAEMPVIVLPNAQPSPPPTVEKRKRGRKPKSSKTVTLDEGSTGMVIGLIIYFSSRILSFANDTALDVPAKKLTYILSILSAEEATKAVSKRMPISMALELNDNEPWDTLKAQLLAKINAALSPHILDFVNYTVMFYISRVLPRPGMILESEDSYSALLLRAANLTSKTPTINLTIQEKKHAEDKENDGALGAGKKEGSKDKKKVYDLVTFSDAAYSHSKLKFL